ncbi:DEAD/DEAH box helicase [Alteracholeplasma palmae J233]|uniref:DEAD/DEAH box helicase n=1 Tax=Alteracholeplasma palmae (strain ATCC 49389 / J233) TaxID=1318466 RepID=U4KNV8_ALTPJ|nr:DEAD/DEAH box helicase [Alteracholeplasma palmae]CCV63895.1 DEAD/DEAH box helicase [Alteracholeplasma palmae J233]
MSDNGKIKTKFTNIYKNEYFGKILDKLSLNLPINENESTYVINLSLVFYDYYLKENQEYYFEFSYYLVLKYFIITGDYNPLYDFSINVGFYPITSLLNKKYKTEIGIFDFINQLKMEKYELNDKIQTKEQYSNKVKLIESKSKYRSFIAPTSFGKSEVILEDIDKLNLLKVAIIVPKKALIWETYRRVKKLAQEKKYKLLIHDTEYNGECRFIGIFTQERALRLLQENNVYFDILYIDEAHNIFEKNERNILLTRLIKLNRKINPKQRIVFLSPLINNSNNLTFEENMEINEKRINFNIKEPDIHFYDERNIEHVYNRFSNRYLERENEENDWRNYIKGRTIKKSLLYVNRPRYVQELALYFSEILPKIPNKQLDEIKEIMIKYVDKEYYMVDLIDKGVLFIHGKMPDSIRDYLIEKYKEIEDIKYLVSNSSVLEGVNFPIDSLFILNTYNLNINNLNNLIGRVNRLNEIFNDKGDLRRLFSPVYFIENAEFGGGNYFRNKIELLRMLDIEDKVKNPVLTNSIEKNIEIYDREETFLSNFKKQDLYAILVRNSIDDFYKEVNECMYKISENIDSFDRKKIVSNENIISIIYEIFFKGFEYGDFKNYEVGRLIKEQTVNFYSSYINFIYHSDFKTKINFFDRHFSKITQEKKLYYIGDSFGEVVKNTDLYENTNRKVYIDIAAKSEKERINLAIVKSKIEDDFVGFEISKFVKALLELKLINQDNYEEFFYNTKSQDKISMLKSGLSQQTINFMEKNELINEVNRTTSGFEASDKFFRMLEDEDDFIKFEINKIFTKSL